MKQINPTSIFLKHTLFEIVSIGLILTQLYQAYLYFNQERYRFYSYLVVIIWITSRIVCSVFSLVAIKKNRKCDYIKSILKILFLSEYIQLFSEKYPNSRKGLIIGQICQTFVYATPILLINSHIVNLDLIENAQFLISLEVIIIIDLILLSLSNILYLILRNKLREMEQPIRSTIQHFIRYILFWYLVSQFLSLNYVLLVSWVVIHLFIAISFAYSIEDIAMRFECFSAYVLQLSQFVIIKNQKLDHLDQIQIHLANNHQNNNQVANNIQVANNNNNNQIQINIQAQNANPAQINQQGQINQQAQQNNQQQINQPGQQNQHVQNNQDLKKTIKVRPWNEVFYLCMIQANVFTLLVLRLILKPTTTSVDYLIYLCLFLTIQHNIYTMLIFYKRAIAIMSFKQIISWHYGGLNISNTMKKLSKNLVNQGYLFINFESLRKSINDIHTTNVVKQQDEIVNNNQKKLVWINQQSFYDDLKEIRTGLKRLFLGKFKSLILFFYDQSQNIQIIFSYNENHILKQKIVLKPDFDRLFANELFDFMQFMVDSNHPISVEANETHLLQLLFNTVRFQRDNIIKNEAHKKVIQGVLSCNYQALSYYKNISNLIPLNPSLVLYDLFDSESYN